MRLLEMLNRSTGIARSFGRARIETFVDPVEDGVCAASPAHLGGRGLKLCCPYDGRYRRGRIARSFGRARIETAHNPASEIPSAGIARSFGRARIETACRKQ